MGQQRFLRVLSVGCAVLLSTPNWASASTKGTTVEPFQGVTLMNAGKGFKQIKKTTKAKAGSSVMVSPDGAATVVYADGCKVDVTPGKVTTITELSPCASGSSAANENYRWCALTNNPDDNCSGAAVTTAALTMMGILIYLGISP